MAHMGSSKIVGALGCPWDGALVGLGGLEVPRGVLS